MGPLRPSCPPPPAPSSLDFLPDRLLSPDREGRSRQCILTTPQDQLKLKTPDWGGCLGEKPGNWGAPSRWVGPLWAPAPRTPSRQQEGPTSTGHLSPPSPTVPAWPSFLSCLALGTEGTEATASHPQARPKESRPLTEPQHRAQASVGSQGPPPAPLSLDPSPSSGRPPAHRHPPHPRQTTRLPCPPGSCAPSPGLHTGPWYPWPSTYSPCSHPRPSTVPKAPGGPGNTRR